jgi:hypothetical protein
MATLYRGDRVIATEGLGGLFSPAVPKGTEGVIVDKRGILSTDYEVHFDNGAVHQCSERQIAKVRRSGSW